MPSLHRAGFCRAAPLAAALSLLLAACGGGAHVKGGTPQVNALYAQLDQASKGYENAVVQSREGNAQGSEKTLAVSLDQLKNASARCGATAGCDPQRFLSVYDRLLRLKDGSFFDVDDVDNIGDATPEKPGTVTQESPVTAVLPQAQRSVTLLHGQQLSQLIAMNGPVKAALEMWLTQWRPNLMDAYVNYQFLRYQMWPAYQQADLPEAVLFGILAKESGGKVHAVSRSGAAGPLQFMYATGMRFGLSSQDGFDLRFDPGEAARANAEYLDEQLAIFNNNLELTLGAYNGGEGRMQRLVNGNAAVSFYDPQIYNQLSQETREYVPAVLAAAWLFLHPDSYNLRFPKVDGAPGQIQLRRPASLEELTVCLGSAGGMQDGWFRTLRNLNPRLDPVVTQPTGVRLQVPKLLEKAYAARCVDGPWPILASDLHHAVVPVVIAPPAPAPAPAAPVRAASRNVRHVVKRGETLGGIVRQHGCSSVDEVAGLNGLKGRRVTVGSTILLPSCR